MPRPSQTPAPPRNVDQPNGLPDLGALVELLADRVAARVVEHLPEPVEPYMTVAQAAEYLACPTSRVYELVERRRVRHYRDGRRVLLRREDLDAALTVEEPGR
jgi:excisionase family DNA binding protein